jgi:hypothetical protein
LELMRDKIFQRTGVGSQLDRVIFGLGRVCTEDFQQAFLLCGNGFGIGAMQMVRGMYERLVTADYLIKHPEYVDDFLDFHFVQLRKGLSHLKLAYTDDELTKLVPNERQEQIEKDYQAVTREGRFQTNSWTKFNVPDMAKQGERGLAEFYYYNYFRPTMFSHSTVSSLLARLCENETGEPIFDNEGQRKHVREGLVGAHLLLLHVFDMQNEYFKLDLYEDIKTLEKDYVECWKG